MAERRTGRLRQTRLALETSSRGWRCLLPGSRNWVPRLEASSPMVLHACSPASRGTGRFRATEACRSKTNKAGDGLRHLTRGRRVVQPKTISSLGATSPSPPVSGDRLGFRCRVICSEGPEAASPPTILGLILRSLPHTLGESFLYWRRTLRRTVSTLDHRQHAAALLEASLVLSCLCRL